MRKLIFIGLFLFCFPLQGSVDFDGDNDYVRIPYDSSLYSEQITVAFWAKSDTANYAGNTYPVTMYDYAGNNRVWAVAIQSDDDWKWVCTTGGAFNTFNTTSQAVETDWNHIAFTYDNSSKDLDFFYNGSEGTIANCGVSYSDQGSWMEFGGLAGAGVFDGQLADIRLYDRILTDQEIKILAKSSMTWTGGIMGWNSNITAIDSSSNTNNGTLVGGPSKVYECVVDGCLDFDGANDYVGSTPDPADAYPITFSGWVKTTDSDGACIVSIADASTSADIIRMYVDTSGNAVASVYNGGAETATGSTAVNTGDWFHLVAVFSSSTHREIYVNGESEAEDTDSINYPDNVDRWDIGRFGDSSPGYYLDGLIDDVRIYNVAISSTDVETLYNSGSGGVDLSTEPVGHWKLDNCGVGLVGYWPMDHGVDGYTLTTSSTIWDRSENGNHGTPNNSPVSRGTSLLSYP